VCYKQFTVALTSTHFSWTKRNKTSLLDICRQRTHEVCHP